MDVSDVIQTDLSTPRRRAKNVTALIAPAIHVYFRVDKKQSTHSLDVFISISKRNRYAQSYHSLLLFPRSFHIWPQR